MRFSYPLPFATAMKLPGRVAFSFSGFDVYWSGLLLASGILLAILLAQFESKRKKLPPDTAVDLCLIGIPVGIVFARLAYVLLNLSAYAANPLSVLYFWDGGLSVYGAILGVLLGIAVYSLKKKLRFFALTDLLFPGLLVVQGLALWGNFFEQTSYGAQIANESLQWFPFAVLIQKTDTIHAAVFFYEFVWCVLVFALLWFVIRKRAKRDGAVSFWYLLLYPLGHIAFEFLRQGGSFLFGSIRLSQVICAALALFALVALLIRARKPAPVAVEETAASPKAEEPDDKAKEDEKKEETEEKPSNEPVAEETKPDGESPKEA